MKQNIFFLNLTTKMKSVMCSYWYPLFRNRSKIQRMFLCYFLKLQIGRYVFGNIWDQQKKSVQIKRGR